MPYVTVPKDFDKVKRKIALGLTKRQLIAAAASAGVCLPAFYYLFPLLGDNAVFIIVILAVPIFIVGFWPIKDGRPIEKVIMNYIRVRYQRPAQGPYKTENIYAGLEPVRQIQEVIDSVEPNDKPTDSDNKAARPLRGSAKARQARSRKAH